MSVGLVVNGSAILLQPPYKASARGLAKTTTESAGTFLLIKANVSVADFCCGPSSVFPPKWAMLKSPGINSSKTIPAIATTFFHVGISVSN